MSYFEPHQVIETGKTAWNFGRSYYTNITFAIPWQKIQAVQLSNQLITILS